MLLLRVDCLAGAVQQAINGGDSATVARLMAELIETSEEARELAAEMRNQ